MYGKWYRGSIVGLRQWVTIIILALPGIAFADDFMATGTYVGDGNPTQAISGLGFQPGFVMVKAASSKRAFAKTSGMPTARSKSLTEHSSLKNGYIKSLDADGFTVGDEFAVNEAGVVFYWVAMIPREGTLEIGEYEGDGDIVNQIPLTNMTPIAGLILGSESTLSVYRHKDMDVAEGFALDGSGEVSSSFAYFGENEFNVLSGEEVNNAGDTYYYVMWGSEAGVVSYGNYDGSLFSNKDISGLGLNPELILIANDSNLEPVFRPGSMTGDASLFYSNRATQNNLIRSMHQDGFQVGTDDSVNDYGKNYQWLALANPTPKSDLNIFVSVDNATPVEGDVVVFTLALTNFGPDLATGVDVTDLLPSGLTFQSATPSQGSYDEETGIWSVGSLETSQSKTLALAVTVDVGTGGSSLANTARVSASDIADPSESNNTSVVDVAVLTSSGTDLDISLAASETAVDEGQEVTYTITLTNNGPDDASGVLVTSLLPGTLILQATDVSQGSYDSDTGIWDVSGVAEGVTHTLTLTASPSIGTSGSIITNTATISGLDQSDPNNTNDSASFDLAVNAVDIQVLKLVDNAIPAEGETVTYTILVTNLGPAEATNLLIAEMLPSGVSFVSATPSQGNYDQGAGIWNVGTMASSETLNLTIEATVDAAMAGSTITNTAAFSNVTQMEENTANNSSSVDIVVRAFGAVDLQVAQTIDNPVPNVGEIFSYEVTLFNDDSSAGTNIEIQDVLPTEVTYVSDMTNKGSFDADVGVWTVGTLEGGFQAVLNIQVRAGSSAVGTTVTNTASILAVDQSDPDGGNNSASVDFNTPTCDLVLENTVDNPAPETGEIVQYTLVLANNGPNAASGIQVTDLLPSGLAFVSSTTGSGTYAEATGAWDLSGLNPGLTDTLLINARIEEEAAGSVVSNQALITSIDQADPSLDNNTATSSITVPGADLEIALISNTAVAFEGSEVQLQLTVLNNGPENARAVELSQLIPTGLSIVSVAASQGTYDQPSGLWTVGNINLSLTATLDITVTVDEGTASTILTSTATVSQSLPTDSSSANNTAAVSITVPDGVLSGNTIWPLVGTSTEIFPGSRSQQNVLTFAFTNQGGQPDTLRSLTVTNLTQGDGASDQMDAEWQSLKLSYQRSTPSQVIVAAVPIVQAFNSGTALFDNLGLVIAPGDTMEVILRSSASLEARDSAHLQVGILSATDLNFTSPYSLVLDWPLVSGQVLNVDGFVAAQAAVVPMESGLLAIGSEQNLALTVDLPGNGYLADTLYGLSLKNNGSAQPGTDISGMQIWSDNGDGEFGNDTLMGSAIHSGDLWQLTGLSVPVPASGRRFFVTVDIAETALPSRDIRLSLPVGNGSAVEMFSGNDGPVDASLENPSTLGISDTDRIILFAEWSLSGTALPGASGVTMLQFLLTNTYDDTRQLQSLTFTNTTEAAGATQAQRDSTCQQLHLVLDTNNNGELDDITIDHQLASGIFSDGKVIFNGLDLDLPPDAGTRVFVTADLGLTTVADGNRIRGHLQSLSDINIPGSTVVATWPLEAGSEWVINGMVAEQITNRDVAILTLGPGEGPVLAMDFDIPPNGYEGDELLGISLANEGSATASDLLVAELWEDGGDGIFNAGIGDDISLGPLTISGNRWSSTVLSRRIPSAGTRLFASITVAESPQDSVTVMLSIPLSGVTVSSGNDGPVDQAVPGLSRLVISTSPLRTSVAFEEKATNTGQNGTITMSVHNAGSDVVTEIVPELHFVSGAEQISLLAPSPAMINTLSPDEDALVTWEYASWEPGEVVLEGNAQGLVNEDQVRRSIFTSTSSHQVFTPVPRLDFYPTANLPFSLNRGQQDVVPLTLTFINPGGLDVADAQLSSIRLRLLESVDGDDIVPADLLEQVIVAEGTNIYFQSTELPGSGSDLNLVFDNPVVITGTEPVTLSLRLDLRLNSTVSSFLVSIEDASWLVGNDVVDQSVLDITLGEGSFPVRTGQATLVAQAAGLNVAMNELPAGLTVPGQNDILLAEFNLSQSAVDDNSSSIDLGRLAFVFHDEQGAPLDDPADYFSRLRLNSSFQNHYSGELVTESDSLVVLQLSAPVTIAGNSSLVLRLFGSLSEESPLGQVTPLLGPADSFDARDGNMNNPVPVLFTTGIPGPVLNILEPVTSLVAAGTGQMPDQVSQGTRNVTVMHLTLMHPGEEGSSAATCDTLSFRFFDASRQPLATTPYLDRVRVMRGTVELGALISPAAVNGTLSLPLTGLELTPGEFIELDARLDFKPDAPTGSMEVVLEARGIKAFDSISGKPLAISAASGSSFPISSAVSAIVAPADELAVAVEDLMPPLLVSGGLPSPVFSIRLSNTAPANSGAIEINGLTFTTGTAKSSSSGLDETLDTIQLRWNDEVVAVSDLGSSSHSVTLTPSAPLIVEAAQSLDLVVEVLVKNDAPEGVLNLVLSEDGVAAGPPGGSGTTVRIMAASGQTFPFVSETGNIGSATLEASYANFPNPFAAGSEPTTFAFSLLKAAEVNLRIMTPHGELVRTILQNEQRAAGFYQSDLWQGVNGNGSLVHNGVYLAELVVKYNDGTSKRILRKVAVVR